PSGTRPHFRKSQPPPHPAKPPTFPNSLPTRPSATSNSAVPTNSSYQRLYSQTTHPNPVIWCNGSTPRCGLHNCSAAALVRFQVWPIIFFSFSPYPHIPKRIFFTSFFPLPFKYSLFHLYRPASSRKHIHTHIHSHME